MALAKAADIFTIYAEHHALKGTVAGYEKALANAYLADQMDKAFDACG